jgi:5,10-methylenetetrahydrofolate reductase
VGAPYPGGGTWQSAARGDEAWLLVSGDNALWRNPKPSHPGILDLLADAAAVRAERLGSGLHAPHAWVVANPLKATTAAAAEAEAEHLLRKVDAGAQAVVTQPAALLPERAERFWEACVRLGVHLPVLVGVAVPTGPTMVEKWLRISDVEPTDADAVALVQRWRAAAAAATDEYERWRRQQLEAALAHARGAPAHHGVHVMPLGERGMVDVLGLVSERLASQPTSPPL